MQCLSGCIRRGTQAGLLEGHSHATTRGGSGAGESELGLTSVTRRQSDWNGKVSGNEEGVINMEPVIQGPVDPSSVSMASLTYKKQPFTTVTVFL